MSSLRMSPDELARYHEQGFLVRRGVFNRADLAAIGQASETLVADLLALRRTEKFEVGSYLFERQWELEVNVKFEPDDPDLIQGIEPCAHLSPGLKALGEDRRLTEPAKDAIGEPGVSPFTEKLNVKRAHRGGRYVLHQDFPYWERFAPTARKIVTAMISLDDATVANGCLEAAPGSHLEGQQRLRDVEGFGALEMDEAAFDISRLKPIETKAGDVVFFGPFLAHRSLPNRSEVDRRALLYSFQPAGNPTARELHRARRLAAEAAGEPLVWR
jgi:phytanoyl-CoA hydroxylase